MKFKTITSSSLYACFILASFAFLIWTASSAQRHEIHHTPSAVLIAATKPIQYPVYGHSVVDGGIHTMDEMYTAKFLHPAYASFDMSAARIVDLPTALVGFVSYRADNKNIYWTRTPMTIPAHEMLFTDGHLFIRARCGNIISLVPMTPTQRETPSDIDTVVAAAPPDLESLESSPMVPTWTSAPPVVPATHTLYVGTIQPNQPPYGYIPLIPVGPIGPAPVTPPTAVPEPATWVLLLIGVTAMLGWKFRADLSDAMMVAGGALMLFLAWFAWDVERQLRGTK
jgi:hypothetical protein